MNIVNNDRILEIFRDWLRNQPLYITSEIPDVRYEQIDDAPYDYISDFCDERKYKESTFERLVDQIDFRNEVFVFLERNGVLK